MRFSIGLGCLGSAVAFNLPGNAPKIYKDSDRVEIKVSKLTSDTAQIPYDYFHVKFCPVTAGQEVSMEENLGQILLGDAVENTPYDLRMREDASCKLLCRQGWSSIDSQRVMEMISENYVINWLVDSLPVGTRPAGSETSPDTPVNWMSGFPIGFQDGERFFVNNHASFTVKYHDLGTSPPTYTVVGVSVIPSSVTFADSSAPNCADASAMHTPFHVGASPVTIPFTYDVKWEKSDIVWASRWDTYLQIKENKIHWFSILNSLLVVLLLTGLIGVVLLRTLHKDIAKYNSVIMDEESSALDDISEEVGWKLVHGDVFRRPRHSKLLAVFIGSGVQILCMVVVSLILAVVGLLSPANRGSYLQAMLLIFTFTGSIAGYVSARVYKMFKGEDWRTTTLWSGLIFPGVAFGVFFSLNLLLWYEGSSAAVPFSAMTVILVLWLGISTPLVYVGAYRGYAKAAIEFPVRVHHIPRQIPKQPWYSKTWIVGMVGGLLPFGAVSTELVFLMSSIWHHQFYYLFGFLFVVVGILIITCAEISVAMTYFQLTGENYHWWWRSFMTSAFAGVYLFLYALVYLSTRLEIVGFVPVVLYLGYMALASFSFFLLTGSVGAIASFLFVRGIYGSIKID